MPRIQLIVHAKANRRLLRQWLSVQHEVVEATDLVAPYRFDLCVIDALMADRLHEQLARLKTGQAPLFIPVLLIVQRQDVGLATRHLWRSIDEIITSPISQIELHARIQQLLQTRSLSQQLQALGELRMLEQLRRAFLQTVELATRLSEMRDPYTAGHERRVADIAVAIGREMGLDENRLLGLRIGGLLHDVGKTAVPIEILTKPGKLKPAEFEMIKLHASAGYEVLREVTFPWPVAQIALQHHERIDGSGYPQGLKGDEILLEARIVAVADVIESMASHRPYRAALGVEQALQEVQKHQGQRYDTDAVNAALAVFRLRGYQIPA
jgi:putative nucleotidyltransferase with HDIG domain